MNAAFCAAPVAKGMAARLLADIDCQAFGLVERGYAVLSQPDGAVSAALTGLLVLAVAFFGYRLLLGHGLALSDAVGLAVRIGIVLMLATSWASWQVIAYDLLARGPAQIAGELLSGIGAPKPLVALDYTLDSLEAVGAGYRIRGGLASPLAGGPAAAAMTLNLAAQILTLSTLGLLVTGRLVLALLLALAPAMAGFLLFDATRGMAEGWIRAMVMAALTPIFVLVLASIEFAILLPLIGRIFAEQAAGRFDTAVTTPVGLVTLTFGLAILAGIAAGGKIAQGIRLPRGRAVAPATNAPAAPAAPAAVAMHPPATRIAQALEGMTRRDPAPAGTGARRLVNMLGRGAAEPSSRLGATPWTESGIQTRPMTLRSSPRRSRAAARRDR